MYTLLLCLPVCLATVSESTPALRGSIGPVYEFATSDWLKDYSETRITDLKVIPGTHNSGAISSRNALVAPAFLWAKNQWRSLSEQMNFGIRFFDLRVSPVTDSEGQVSLSLSHHFITSITLESALSDIRSFLSSNPSEFMMVHVRIDSSVRANHDQRVELVSLLHSQITKHLPTYPPQSVNGSQSLANVRVKDVAGKAIIITEGDVISKAPKFSGDSLFWSNQSVLNLVELWHETPGVALRRIDDFAGVQSKPTAWYMVDLFCGFISSRQCPEYRPRDEENSHGKGLEGITLDVYGAYGLPPLAVSWYYNRYFSSAIEATHPGKLGLVLVDVASASYVDSLFKVSS